MLIHLRTISSDEKPAFRQANIDAMVAGLTFYRRANQAAVLPFCEKQIDIEIQQAEQSKDEIILSIVDSQSNKVVGSMWYRLHQEPVYSDLAFIAWLGIYPEFRALGYAKAAIKLLSTKLKNHGIQRIALQAFNNHSESIGLYQSCGFEAKRTIMHKYL